MERKLILKYFVFLLIVLTNLQSAKLDRPAGTNMGDVLKSIDPDEFLEKRGELYKAPEKPILEPSDINKPNARIDDKAKVFIKTFRFSHNSAISSEKLIKLVKDYENKELNLYSMQELTTIITKYYREKGYFVARAYIPAQELENNILEIAVIEGKHGEFKLKNSSLVKDEVILNYLNNIKKGDYVLDNKLERELLIIDELSGARVINSDVYPGAEIGESDFLVSLDKSAKYSAYAMIDNYGTKYTGEHRLNLGANINSITGIGDILSFNTLISENTNLLNYGLTYSRHIAYSGLNGGIGLSKTDYEMDKMGDFEVLGSSLNLNLFLSYPLVKTHSTLRAIQINSTISKMDDESGPKSYTEIAKKQDSNLMIKLNEKRPTSILSRPGTLNAYIGYSFGNLSMDNDIAKDTDLLLKSEGFYHKIVAYLGHQQYIVPKITLQTSIKIQKNLGRNLDGGQRISVAGSNGVRAYEDSELSGDSGYSASLDLIYSLPNFSNYFHNISIFTDFAEVKRNTKTFNDDKNSRRLGAYGLGYAFSYKDFNFKTTYGFGFGSEKEPTVEKEFSKKAEKFLFQAIYQF
ncbi:ShlB/FhaC/HecB family hemolysin secretion/activation protein [Aliarcobacter thereius]|uniref:ShlB/FhaC/HecB family hemolysin secretion/activation protein n=1 Tax=Aliarcobacter thereius TaxID=544718 RepID=A0A5R9H421_9BACT|nr:ShlB/FhaC/HecB family hemolysin secretion/activation protein [Aliarcobacter thereius]TLS72068.1 ShlB/FhaC/HecB family hemolysin secretion/activation protein [Aliarcobacter thereius]TLT07323.1 ShlB/FhaC/HecB family hemolysin secretion/activation protein [Aliarcobacter thereius]